MEHLSNKQLLELLSAGPETEWARYHLGECAECRGRLAALREPWKVLGQWTVEEPAVDLTDGIMSQVRPMRTTRLWQGRTLIRIAASIILGIGLGTLVGEPKQTVISDQQVAETMYLHALSLHSPTGWTSPLLIETGGY